MSLIGAPFWLVKSDKGDEGIFPPGWMPHKGTLSSSRSPSPSIALLFGNNPSAKPIINHEDTQALWTGGWLISDTTLAGFNHPVA